jgi:hypothetical protein
MIIPDYSETGDLTGLGRRAVQAADVFEVLEPQLLLARHLFGLSAQPWAFL